MPFMKKMIALSVLAAGLAATTLVGRIPQAHAQAGEFQTCDDVKSYMIQHDLDGDPPYIYKSIVCDNEAHRAIVTYNRWVYQPRLDRERQKLFTVDRTFFELLDPPYTYEPR
jgi:hypothetical protein